MLGLDSAPENSRLLDKSLNLTESRFIAVLIW